MTGRPQRVEIPSTRASRWVVSRAIRALCAASALSTSLSGCIDFGEPQPYEPDGEDNAIDGGGGAAGAASGAGGAGGGTTGANETIVTIANLSFSPNEVTIDAGSTVRWLMEDAGVFHFLVEGAPDSTEDPLFDTPRLDPGEEFTYTFERPGDYTYYCSNHASTMSDAKVTVE